MHRLRMCGSDNRYNVREGINHKKKKKKKLIILEGELCDTPTRFTIKSSESHQAVAGIVIDSIHAGCTVSTRVVNTIVDI